MSGRGDSIRILHIDDEVRVGNLVESLLEAERESFEVVTATTPSEALAYLDSNAVDCIVSDYDMPGMDGLELLDAVRETYPDLPFILFTGKGTEDIASQAISAGVTDYLQKETGKDQYTVLANRIENAVDRRERDRQFETLVDNLPGIVYRSVTTTDRDSGFVAGDVESVTGYATDELAGHELLWRTDILHAQDDDIREEVHDQLRIDDSFEVTYRIVTKDGETRWVWERGKQVGVSADGDPIIEGVISDVTERKERERELQEETQFIEQALDALNDVFFVIAPDGNIERWNSKANEFGYTDAEIAEMDAFGPFPEDHHTRVSEAIEEVLATGQATVEADFLTGDGERVPHELTGRTLTDTDGNTRGVAGIARDISERKERERELQEEKQFIEQALDALNDVFYVVDPSGDIERWNSKGNELLGYSDAELAEMVAFDVFPEDHHDRISQAIEEILTTGQATVEADFLTVDGERIPHEFVGRQLTDTDGNIRGIAGIARDITERKQRERELERYEQFVEYSPDFFVLLDGDMTVEYQSPISPLSEWDPQQLTGEQALEYIHENDHDRVQEQFEQLLSNPDEIASAEYRGKQASGDWVWVESRAQNFIGQEPIDGILATLRNITERKERERELERQNERLEEFAHVVSHDLQNPLHVASIHLEMAAEETGCDHVDEARRSLDRMEQLIDDLLQLARQGQAVGETEPVGLHDLAERCWRNVETGEAQIDTATDATVNADESRLQGLLENLFHNAVAHGGESVTVTVGTLADGSGFYVEDDGVGIPAEERERIFESGYSTHEDGTGFGLAIVEQIADAHGWDIRLTESDAGGTRFEFTGAEPAGERANGREKVSG